MDKELRDLEQQLGKLNPTAMPADLIARMENAMQRWQDSAQTDDKIVPFPQTPAVKGRDHHRHFNLIASAAAVTLIGAVTWMLNQSPPPAVETAQNTQDSALVTHTSQPISSNNIQLASAPELGSSIQSASDNTITYDKNGRPMRIVSVELVDEIVMKDTKGRKFTIKRPRTEHYLMPVEVH